MKRGGGRFAKLLGSFWRSPKVQALSPEARALYCAGLSYAADLATDGRIPKNMLAALHPGMPPAVPAAMLCASLNGECPFWYDRGEHYEIHDFLEENPSRAELEALSERGREKAQRRWQSAAGAPATNAPSNAPGIADSNAPSNANGNAIPDPRSQLRERDARVRASDPDWVLALRVFDEAWEAGRGQQLGLEAAAFKNRREGESLVAWARGAAGDGWLDKLRELAKHALADPFVGKSKFPLAAVSKSPGSIGPAPEAAPPPPKTREDILREIREHNARVPRMGT